MLVVHEGRVIKVNPTLRHDASPHVDRIYTNNVAFIGSGEEKEEKEEQIHCDSCQGRELMSCWAS